MKGAKREAAATRAGDEADAERPTSTRGGEQRGRDEERSRDAEKQRSRGEEKQRSRDEEKQRRGEDGEEWDEAASRGSQRGIKEARNLARSVLPFEPTRPSSLAPTRSHPT